MAFSKIRKLTRFAGQAVSQTVANNPLNTVEQLNRSKSNASTITGWESTIRSTGISRPNRYEVVLTPPSGVVRLMRDRKLPVTSLDLNEVGLRIGSIELPGRNVSSLEHRTTGLFRKMPYHVQYNELNMSIILSESLYERTLLETWQDAIYNNADNDVNYYNDIVGTIIIRQLTQDDGIAKTIKITEVYPNILSPVELSYDNNNSFSRQTVTFNFHKWEAEGSEGRNFPIILTPPDFKEFIQDLNENVSIAKDFIDLIDINADRLSGLIP